MDETTHEPGLPAARRSSDADRDRVVHALGEHCAEGRLTLEELSQRVERALAARTQDELDALLRDLPAAPHADEALPAQPQAPRRRVSRFVIAVMGGATRRGRWRPAAHVTALAVMGGCHLDLRRAELHGATIDITALAVMGGIEVVVPPGIDVDVTGFALMGGNDQRLADVPVLPGTPQVRVRAVSVMGGVNVRTKGRTSPGDAQAA